MTLVRPDYYDRFACIADKCTHNCCIGWEIDIDDETIKKYERITGDFSERLKKNISYEGTAHFILGEDERCPFLNEKNLCDIITTLGEDHLCGICSEHPRFYNIYSSFTEAGIGLCCEETARLIISSEDPFTLSGTEEINYDALTDAEKDFLNIRSEIFRILSQSEKPLRERAEEVFLMMNISYEDLYSHDWYGEFLQCEILDESWKDHLGYLSLQEENPHFPFEKYEKAFENLLYYFIYRHLHGCLYDGYLNERLAFSFLCVFVIYRIAWGKHSRDGLSYEILTEIARMFSAETEYSEDNTGFLLDTLFEII